MTRLGFPGITGSPSRLAHRKAWTLANGPVPEGLDVLHHCDNRACGKAIVDSSGPSHLFVGTMSDNMRDMYAKGRNPRNMPAGEEHWSHKRPQDIPRGEECDWVSKLGEAGVYNIRTSFASGKWTLKRLARKYGVAIETIYKIVHGATWTHVGGPIAPMVGPRRGDNHPARTRPECVPRGQATGHAKLSAEQVVELRERAASGKHTLQELADAYGVSKPLVCLITKGRVWTHVGGPLSTERRRRAPDGFARGEATGHATLTEDDVRAIRAAAATKESQRAIAARFGVSPSSVCLIVARKTWTHVE